MGQRGHSKLRGLRFFSTGKEMKIINWEHVLLCTVE